MAWKQRAILGENGFERGIRTKWLAGCKSAVEALDGRERRESRLRELANSAETKAITSFFKSSDLLQLNIGHASRLIDARVTNHFKPDALR